MDLRIALWAPVSASRSGTACQSPWRAETSKQGADAVIETRAAYEEYRINYISRPDCGV